MTLELLETVAEHIRSYGSPCTVEYPGFLLIEENPETLGYWAVGTANGNWGGDYSNSEQPSGGPDQAFEIADSAEWTDATRIGNAILESIRHASTL